MIIIVRIVIIAFKGAIRDFLQSPHGTAKCLQHVRSNHMQHIKRSSRAICRASHAFRDLFSPVINNSGSGERKEEEED